MVQLPSSGDVQRVGVARQPAVRAPASLLSAVNAHIAAQDFDLAREIVTGEAFAVDISPELRTPLLDKIAREEEAARRKAEQEAAAAAAQNRARLAITIDDAMAAARVTGSDPFETVPVDSIVSAYGEDAVSIVRDLQAAQAIGTAQQDVDAAFARGGPTAVADLLAEIQVEGENARNEATVQAAREQAAQALVFDTALQNQGARLADGLPIDPAFESLARQLLPAPEADRLMARLNLAADQAAAGQAIERATLDELRTMVTSPLTIDPNDPFYFERAQMRSLVLQQAGDTMERIVSDPFGYVAATAEHHPGVPAALDTLRAPDASPDDIAGAIEVMVAAQRNVLGPGNERFVSVMGKDQAAAFIGELQTMSPTEWPTTIYGFIDSFGEKYEGRAIAALVAAGLPSEAQVFAFYGDDLAARPQLTRLATLLAEGGRDVLLRAVKATPNAAEIPKVADELSYALEAFGLSLAASGSGGGLEVYEALASSLELLVLDDMRRNIDVTTSVNRHTDAFINKRYNFVRVDETIYRVDGRYNAEKVDRVALETIMSLTPESLMPVGGVTPGLTPEEGLQNLHSAILNNERWVTNETDDGIVLMMPMELGGLPVRRADGSRIEVLFDDAELRDLDDLPLREDPTRGMTFMGIPVPEQPVTPPDSWFGLEF